ncbi:phosphoenolpyruvate carboxylase [Daejeonella sp. JGW-45]|uniref:phosphoenolpyruvate carboxylase n=1 Tax=Daejeonella sp. JGW-45 TaxID=3034148 RepID=UPI0023EB0C26|nr:phosphoenolpyruvate carboxylase [Daejeonella sp. JGW-45]
MSSALAEFKNLVGTKFEMYNSLFTSLPFHRVEKTGILLSLFLLHCEEGFRKEQSPAEIIESFFRQYTTYENEKDQIDLLFRFIQYSERQVVLFDALEDAAFGATHDMNGSGTLKQLQAEVIQSNAQQALAEKLKDFSVRMVLTAHPNQFYPSEVLGIIHDLGKALLRDDTVLVNTYLQQLGKTPFFKKKKPTPYDEAVNLIWFLENVFYHSAGNILSFLTNEFPGVVTEKNQLIRMGFWPGGDRDGNPFVKADTTLKVAEALRGSIIKCYYRDVRLLKGRLTFQGVDTLLATLEDRLYKNLFIPGYKADLSKEEITDTLKEIRDILIEKHNSLFLAKVNNLLTKVNLFGLFFASLDVRQDSSAHKELIEQIAEKTSVLPENYTSLSDEAKIKTLQSVDALVVDTDIDKDAFETLLTIQTVQKFNGSEGCHRYIISHTTSAVDVMEVYALFVMAGWKKEHLTVDFVPLFETIGDLQNAAKAMTLLYQNEAYQKHLKRRDRVQTIMLGFSDGTKDGGYLMANWSIYKAKEELTRISREYDVEVVFFDGRGGPPARGGGKTHQFYASMGQNIANKEIQLTIQGQTISSNFGTREAARYNIEQLMHSGISNGLFSSRTATMSQSEEQLLQELSDESYDAFRILKDDPDFLEYLNFASPLRYYAEANIGSRPSKRKAGKLNLNDLRAVPYVGAWSQLKQNIPGYYGVGIAFEKMEKEGKWNQVMELYQSSLYFRTLIGNCEMAMSKCFFPLTAYLSKHPKYGVLWNMFHDEFMRTKKYTLMLTGKSELMSERETDQLSIQMRQRIELPLITIQQYALTMIREKGNKVDSPGVEIFEKLVMRCSFGIINAERNSA